MKKIDSNNKKYTQNKSSKNINALKKNGDTLIKENNMNKNFKSSQRKYDLKDIKFPNKINKIDKTV
tara:strand:+ start:1046 stop:1243 length:198 start_codon:yes stop_codon:yes gene_type:complete